MARRSALIVDSDAGSAKLASLLLEQVGWLALVAHSVDAGRRVLDLLQVSVVVLEPGPSHERGVAYLHAFRAAFPQLPIAIVSTNGWDAIAEREGCHFIRKPLDVATFATQLIAIVEGSQ